MVLFLHNTSKVDDEPYPDLLQEKGGTGFPYLAVMDAEGEVIAPHNGPRSVEAFAKTVAAAADYRDLKKRYESGDKAAAAGYLKAGLDLGTVAADVARKILTDLEGLGEAEIKEINNKIFAVEFSTVIGNVQSQEGAIVAGATFIAMIENGYSPDEVQATNLWAMISYHAEDQKDAELLARAIEEFKKVSQPNGFRDINIKRMEKALEQIKN